MRIITCHIRVFQQMLHDFLQHLAILLKLLLMHGDANLKGSTDLLRRKNRWVAGSTDINVHCAVPVIITYFNMVVLQGLGELNGLPADPRRLSFVLKVKRCFMYC